MTRIEYHGLICPMCKHAQWTIQYQTRYEFPGPIHTLPYSPEIESAYNAVMGTHIDEFLCTCIVCHYQTVYPVSKIIYDKANCHVNVYKELPDTMESLDAESV